MSNSKIAVTATMGTMLEWAEYTFFGYMANQLSTLFFNPLDSELALIKTYAIFAASYFMRPIGSIFFGHLGDKYGRKPILMISMLLMGFATMMIGLLPTYDHAGTKAALFLLMCRLLQGIAVSGEFHGAITFLHEHAKKRPFWMGSLAPMAAAFGMAIGAFAATLTSLPNAPTFAWRIPFLCSGFLCLIALYLRTHVEETPLFMQAKKNRHLVKFPLIKIFQKNKRALFTNAAMAFFIAVYVYIGNIFYKSLCIKSGISLSTSSQIVTFGQILAAFSILICGRFADDFGGKKLCLFGLRLAIIASPFIISSALSGNIYQAILGQCIYAIINGLVSGPMMTLLMSLFPTETRFTGGSFGWNISAALLGGTALIVAEILTNLWGAIAPGVYISFAAALALLGIQMMFKEREMVVSTHYREA